MSYLGNVGLIQFKELNSNKSPFQRTYAAQVVVDEWASGDICFEEDCLHYQFVGSCSGGLQAKYGAVDMDYVLGVGGYDLERVETEVQLKSSSCGDHDHVHNHEHARGHHHHDPVHDSAVSSSSIVCEGTLALDELDYWLECLLEEKGDDLYRLKGVLLVARSEQCYVLQGVHSMLDGCPGRTWDSDEKRINKLVFIGKHLDEAALKKGFKGCLA